MANEKRLIYANALMARYRDVDYETKDTPWTLRDILFFLEKAPTVDAVEVVRCKDCEYRHDSCFAGNGNTYCDFHHKYFPLDGFCSYGERRIDV